MSQDAPQDGDTLRSSGTAVTSRLDRALVRDEGTGRMFEVEADEIVLDAGLEADIDLAHGCRVGVCGACAVTVEEGDEHLLEPDAIEEETLGRLQLGARVRLACRMRTRGPLRIRPLE